MEEDKKGGACGTNGAEVIQGVGVGILKEREHVENLGVDGKILLSVCQKK